MLIIHMELEKKWKPVYGNGVEVKMKNKKPQEGEVNYVCRDFDGESFIITAPNWMTKEAVERQYNAIVLCTVD